MSFVQAPDRSENGVTQIYGSPSMAIDGHDFPSVLSAMEYMLDPANQVVASEIPMLQRRDRQEMQNGVYTDGHFSPTGYYSYAANVEYKNRTCWYVLKEQNAPEKFGFRYRDIGIGHLGGQSTGLSNPHHVFRRRDSLDSFARVANMSIVDNDVTRAEVECLIRARNQKWDASEFVSGVIPTVMMVVDKVRQVIIARQQLARGNVAGALTALALNPRSISQKKLRLSSLSERWLALIYGWLPLLNDIYQGVNLVNAGLSLPDTTFTVKRRVRSHLPFTQWLLNPNDDPWTDPKLTASVISTVDVKYRCRISDPVAASLTSLGLENPLYLAWVAMPYSFVIDWLSPVSTWLQALSAPLGLQFVNGYRSIHIEGVLDLECGPFGLSQNDPRIVERSDRAKARINFLELERHVYSTFPQARLYFRFPFTTKNSQRVVSTIALLDSQRRR